MGRYRILDSAGSELGIVEDSRDTIDPGDTIALPDGGSATVLDVYDDDDGREGGVAATLATDVD